MIYADNAATTKLDREAFEAMKLFLLEDYSNPSQLYSFSRKSKKAIKEAREKIACCIGADSDEIVFTSGGTESDNWVIKNLFSKGGVVTSAIEHHAILNSCKYIESRGQEVIYIKPDREGLIKPDDLRAAITPDTKLVSIMLANNEIGSVQEIDKLIEVAHENNCLFHTDAVQAVGHLRIDVHGLGIDLMSASAHKFNGPKGIGFLYIRKGINIIPFINGGLQEAGYRAGTENVASIVAMAIALKNNCDDIDKNKEKLLRLEELLLVKLKEYKIDFVRNGSSKHIPGNLSLSFAGCDGEMLLHRLDLMGICVSTGSACNSVNTELSHVIRSIGVPEKYAYGTIRVSLGKDNTEEDVEKIADALLKVIKK